MDEDKKAIRILSFDNGGPGTYSQLLIVKEYMARIAHDFEVDECDVYPADYFDLMGGVGFGGLAALLLGHLRLDMDKAIEALLNIATTIPSTSSEDQITLEENTKSLFKVVSEVMEDCGIALDVKMHDKRVSPPKCKVAIYASTTANLSHSVTFRTYPRCGLNTNLAIVDAICSTLACPSVFAPVIVRNGPRQQKYVGGVHGANNPTRELLKEAGSIFGEDIHVAQILSIGAGRPRVSHLDQATLAGVNRVLEALAMDCEGVAVELSTRLSGVEAYLRLNVDRGMESAGMHDWDDLGSIETHTSAYMDNPTIQEYIEASLQRLHGRVGLVTLREINYSNSQFIRVSGTPPTDIATKIAEANDTIALLKALCEWLRTLHTKECTRLLDCSCFR
ncbi:hypothetical protein M408DRAFT_333464 [Serendipita vermifera MAFF 305830]|uniref:PNPLA domain-containing protein n=1 Tax=Serendipita vermifera MAFF 305830 TaxID=933852 RepID=A0A0C3AQA1_SERVB|nr:hypothetical protein M408DRAFT_333464 [Serendipita vermifera MAFF 305830]